MKTDYQYVLYQGVCVRARARVNAASFDDE